MTTRVERVVPMKRRSPAPSSRLLAAATAERDGLSRRRGQLLSQRDALEMQLEDINAELAELAERDVLIERLTGGDHGDLAPTPTPSRVDRAANTPNTMLRGPRIRQTAVQVLLSDPRRPEALHYRDWFGLMTEAGYAIAGKDPAAVFLTQITRSPVVRRATKSGVYELDLGAIDRLGHSLAERRQRLRALTGSTTPAADLGNVRSERNALNREIDKLEKALEEAQLSLSDPAAQIAAAS